jgi:hypothetical protein
MMDRLLRQGQTIDCPQVFGFSKTLTFRDIYAAIGHCVLPPLGILKTAKLWLQEEFVNIPTNLITNEYAFSFADSGWHYFRELIADYESNPGIAMQESTFFRFFQHERVRSIRYLNDVLFLHDPDHQNNNNDYKFYMGTYPWGEWGPNGEINAGVAWGYHYDFIEGKMTRDLYGYRRDPWYQPGDEHPLAIEWNQTLQVYRSLKRGYRPVWHGTYPEVLLLLRSDGQMRAMVEQGQHRVSSLSHLGYKELSLLLRRDSMRIIREDEVERWYYVHNGLCTKEQALRIFNAFFELDGRERAKYLNLNAAY